MESKSSKKRMVVYGGAGTVVLLCIVGLILFLGVPELLEKSFNPCFWLISQLTSNFTL